MPDPEGPPEDYLEILGERTGPDPWEHRPGPRARLAARWRYLTARPVTLRLGRLEFTLRWRHPCDACASRGWSYSKGSLNPVPMPEGYDGVSLCGCGNAIGSLAASRAYVRGFDHRMRKEGPF
jgi:hypothetical protein